MSLRTQVRLSNILLIILILVLLYITWIKVPSYLSQAEYLLDRADTLKRLLFRNL